MNDEDLKALLQKAGFHNTHSPYEAAGTLANFRELVKLVQEKSK